MPEDLTKLFPELSEMLVGALFDGCPQDKCPQCFHHTFNDCPMCDSKFYANYGKMARHHKSVCTFRLLDKNFRYLVDKKIAELITELNCMTKAFADSVQNHHRLVIKALRDNTFTRELSDRQFEQYSSVGGEVYLFASRFMSPRALVAFRGFLQQCTSDTYELISGYEKSETPSSIQDTCLEFVRLRTERVCCILPSAANFMSMLSNSCYIHGCGIPGACRRYTHNGGHESHYYYHEFATFERIDGSYSTVYCPSLCFKDQCLSAESPPVKVSVDKRNRARLDALFATRSVLTPFTHSGAYQLQYDAFACSGASNVFKGIFKRDDMHMQSREWEPDRLGVLRNSASISQDQLDESTVVNGINHIKHFSSSILYISVHQIDVVHSVVMLMNHVDLPEHSLERAIGVTEREEALCKEWVEHMLRIQDDHANSYEYNMSQVQFAIRANASTPLLDLCDLEARCPRALRKFELWFDCRHFARLSEATDVLKILERIFFVYGHEFLALEKGMHGQNSSYEAKSFVCGFHEIELSIIDSGRWPENLSSMFRHITRLELARAANVYSMINACALFDRLVGSSLEFLGTRFAFMRFGAKMKDGGRVVFKLERGDSVFDFFQFDNRDVVIKGYFDDVFPMVKKEEWVVQSFNLLSARVSTMHAALILVGVQNRHSLDEMVKARGQGCATPGTLVAEQYKY